jgi:hypothetical protein
MSAEKCVWNIPRRPDSQVASDGIILALVHEQKMTAPISRAAAGLGQRGLGGQQRDVVEVERGVEPLADAGLLLDLHRGHG